MIIGAFSTDIQETLPMMRSEIEIERLEILSGAYGSVYKLKDRSGTRYIWLEHHAASGYKKNNLGVQQKITETFYDFHSPETMYIDIKFPIAGEQPSFLPRPGPLFEDDYKALSERLKSIGSHVKIIPPEATRPRPAPGSAQKGPAPR